MQSWFFRNDDLATLDTLAVQRVNVGARESRHNPETRRHELKIPAPEFLLKELFHARVVVPLDQRVAW